MSLKRSKAVPFRAGIFDSQFNTLSLAPTPVQPRNFFLSDLQPTSSNSGSCTISANAYQQLSLLRIKCLYPQSAKATLQAIEKPLCIYLIGSSHSKIVHVGVNHVIIMIEITPQNKEISLSMLAVSVDPSIRREKIVVSFSANCSL